MPAHRSLRLLGTSRAVLWSIDATAENSAQSPKDPWNRHAWKQKRDVDYLLTKSNGHYRIRHQAASGARPPSQVRARDALGRPAVGQRQSTRRRMTRMPADHHSPLGEKLTGSASQ